MLHVNILSSGKKSDPSDLDALLRELLTKENPNPWYYSAETFDGGQMQKKAPSGFMGMRGKKDQGWADAITGSPARGKLHYKFACPERVRGALLQQS
jgi:hypothetical protein